MTRKKNIDLEPMPTNKFAAPPGWLTRSFTTVTHAGPEDSLDDSDDSMVAGPVIFLFLADVFVRIKSAGCETIAAAVVGANACEQ